MKIEGDDRIELCSYVKNICSKWKKRAAAAAEAERNGTCITLFEEERVYIGVR